VVAATQHRPTFLGCEAIPQDYQQNSADLGRRTGINKSAMLIFTFTNLTTTMTPAAIG
jgi:hypothetical protein